MYKKDTKKKKNLKLATSTPQARSMSSPKLQMSLRMTKQTKWLLCPAKTQISLGIRLVWSESSLSAGRIIWSLATKKAHTEDTDKTGRMPRLIWVFAERTATLEKGGGQGRRQEGGCCNMI